MTIPNNGQFAMRFEEHTSHYNGSKSSASGGTSQMTQLRQQAMDNIYAMAKSKGISIDTAVTNILTNSDTELKTYIQSKGETPVPDPVGRAVQATLLRASDIATTGSILDISDEDSLKAIESAESDIVSSNSPDQDSLLTPPTQAAIACALQFASEQSGGKSMAQIVNGVSNLAANISSRANNDDGSDDISDWLDWDSDDSTTADPATTAAATTDVNLSPVSVGSSLATIPVSAPSSSIAGAAPGSIAAGLPTIATAASAAAQVPASGPSNQTVSGGVLSSISGLLSGITSVAGQVTSAAKSVSATGTALNTAVGSLGASSISTYVQNNLPMLLILFAIVIAAIYYGGRNK